MGGAEVHLHEIFKRIAKKGHNITLVAHGKENMSILTKKEIFSILNRGYNAPKALIEYLNFNPLFPQYHNKYIPSMKDTTVSVLGDAGWELRDRDSVTEETLGKTLDYIREVYQQYKSLSNTKKKALCQVSKLKETDKEDDVIKAQKKEIKLLMYNKRGIVQKTKKITDNK